tara:strand:+ start:141 stop:386 length:246 start_codon:yes stop_codon:yes gene_type:complete
MEPGYSYGLIATLVGIVYGAYSGYKKSTITPDSSDDKDDTTAKEGDGTLRLIKSVLRGAWYGGAIFGLITFFFVYLIQKYN